MRLVYLGGSARRGLTGGRSPVMIAAIAAAGVAVTATVLVVQSLASILLGAVALLIVVAVLTPTEVGGLGGGTAAGRAARWWRHKRRVATGLALFVPGTAAVRAKGGAATTRPRVVPDWVEQVRAVDVDTTAGSQSGQVCVLIHRPTTGPKYLTVVLEVDTAGGGVQAQAEEEAEYERWGRVQAALAREGSLVRGLQQIERVAPPTPTGHHRWLHEVVPPAAPAQVAASYRDLLERLSWSAEIHHTLLVLRMPVTVAWDSRARDAFGGESDETSAQLAVMEAARVARLLVGEGGIRRARALSQPQLAAAIRACLSDEWSWTDLEDEHGQPVTLTSCWPVMDARDPRMVQVGAGRWIRTARVQTGVMPGDALPVTVLRRLVTGLYPAVVRTMSVIAELVPAAKARSEARGEVTQDVASVAASTAVEDGSRGDTLTASTVRLRDLRPGTGHAGVRWAMHITVSGEDPAALGRACEQLEGACGDIGIPIRWLDEEQDLALAAVLPLGRGISFTTRKVSR